MRHRLLTVIAAMLIGAAISVIPVAFGTSARSLSQGAYGGPSYLSSVAPGNAFDGAASTYWQGSYNTDLSGSSSPVTATSWTLGYTYATAQTVSSIEVDYAVDSRFVATNTVARCTANGTSWSTLGTFPAGQTATLTITPAVCLTVEVVMGAPGTGYTPAVSEIKITTGTVVAQPATVELVGDSITQGSYGPLPYPSLLAIWTAATIINEGVSGNTTEQMLARMPTALSHGAQLVVVMGGTNDCQFGWPTSRSMTALESIVSAINTAGAAPVLVGPIPRVPTSTGVQFTACLLALHDAMRDWSRANTVPFIDPWPAFESSPGSGLPASALTVDGVHPSGRGALLLARTVAHGLGWGFAGD